MPKVSVGGINFDALTEQEVITAVRSALDKGDGGRIFTPNIDIARRIGEAQPFLDDATFVVADGMPLMWAAALARTPLPERVTGSGLISSLSGALGIDRRSVYLIGGTPAGRDGSPKQEGSTATDGAARAAAALAQACPGLRIVGASAPPYGFEETEAYAELCADVIEAKPDVVYVGLGFPKQEHVIDRLRTELPSTWFVGCGAAVQFLGGELNRAPQWMRNSGMEWVHRLLSEPRRLARRYLVHDAPFAARLLLAAARNKPVARHRMPAS